MPMMSAPLARLLHAAAATTVLAAMLAGLAGCSDDGDSPAPDPAPATAQAVADSAVATWNAPLQIDVLANDQVSHGDKRLAAVANPPSNGRAVIADGRIVYTPRAGFFGSDSLRYTLRAADGGASAEAEVLITVEAALLLNGQAVDAPLAAAAVQISGAASAAATTDAQGQWQARVRIGDPQAVLRITARGSGAQQHVQLVSVVAAVDLAAAADTDGQVSVPAQTALTQSHFSTALAALAERGLAAAPATATTLAAAQAAVSPDALLQLATLIHMLADEGLALPTGVADTWALARDADAAAGLLAQVQQASDDGALFEAAQSRALAAEPVAAALPTSGVLVAYPVSIGAGGGAVFSLAADGSATVVHHLGSRSARWTQDATGLVLQLDRPLSSTSTTGDEDPVTGLQNQQRLDVGSFRMKRLPGGLLALGAAQQLTILDGSRAGQVQTLSTLSTLGDPGHAHRLAIDPAAAAPLAAADFAPGKRWAGVLDRPQADAMASADVLEITGAGAGRALRSGITHMVQTSGASFTLVGSDGSRREYLRLGDAGAGAQFFMVFDRSDAELRAEPAVLVPPGEAFAFDASSASRTWSWQIAPSIPPTLISLRADGSGSYFREVSWRVLDDGRLQILRPTSATRQSRYDWIPLRRGSDGSVWLLRRLVVENPAAPVLDDAPGSLWLVIRCLDTGPAS